MKEQTDKCLAAKRIERDLLHLYKSPIITGEDLQRALGYKTQDGLRQAIVRKTVPVHIFTIEQRRGKFALVADIAIWLARQSMQSGD